MKKSINILLLLYTGIIYGQAKHDYNWPLGYGPINDPAQFYGGSLLQFSEDSVFVSFFEISSGNSSENANISNKEGLLVAYTNGCQIQNRMHQLMENGDNINSGIVHNQQCIEGGGYPNDQGALFLPAPRSDSIYYLFHLRSNDLGYLDNQLLFSIVDAEGDAGLGTVTAKNQFLMLDTISVLFTATKHGNGRDWWILLQRNYNRFNTALPQGEKAQYHKYLLDPSGVRYIGTQTIGKLWTPETWAGQSCFSPDGARYAIGNPYNGINLFRFDRCSGELFDPIHLDFSSDTTYSMGIAFSPNSRYMYATTGKYLFQYDMEAPDMPASKLAVAEYDGFLSPFPASFYQLALAPDGKIYGTAPNGSNVLHIIHQPDEPGLNCMVQQHGLQLPTYHSYTTPNVPHYRLGRLVGSACDSLGISATVQPWQNAGKMSIAPNPSDDVIVVSNADMEEGLISLYDLSGKLWLTQKVTEAQGSVTLTVKAIPAGVYFLQFKGDSGKTSNGKLVIQH